MSERKIIEIPEICRVEGHSAVHVDIAGGKVEKVQLDVFEGTRFFEKIVIGHNYKEMPHISSRVCAICSMGHVLAAAFACERIAKFTPPPNVTMIRELAHLGMIIESHATHICALALPDFLAIPDLMEFAGKHEAEFSTWTKLRAYGALIQTIVGGRPFHPVNLQVGGISRFPGHEDLKPILDENKECLKLALSLCTLLLGFKPKVARTTVPVFLALMPPDDQYGFFGERICTSDNFEDSIDNYRQYLEERAVPYSHAKRSEYKGKPVMVGSMARLNLFGNRLQNEARYVYQTSPLAKGDTNTLWNNLAQAIELVHAIERVSEIVNLFLADNNHKQAHEEISPLGKFSGKGAGAIECPRGTLYHFYNIDEKGQIVQADMITPSAQNTARIERDIEEIVNQSQDPESKELQANLETLVRAYDPCNTCATHMVSVSYRPERN